MEGETVFDPFGGLGTVPFRALRLRRRGTAIELNPQYFDEAVRYCSAQAETLATPSLFDFLGDSNDSATPDQIEDAA
jgi:tRNA G37 N-methylase Trm5